MSALPLKSRHQLSALGCPLSGRHPVAESTGPKTTLINKFFQICTAPR
jgi:hypothetical protein